ncbi:MAG: response regulator [Verrucomicrobiota bacterium]
MKKILLIDDDDAVREMFALALRRDGYDVIEANCGSLGLALARQHLPDLILSDIRMPDGDGAALLRDIRADPALRARQVVLMTGRPDLATPRTTMDEGADDFLAKPVELKALLACVRARFRRASISWRVEDGLLTRLQSSLPANLPHEFFTPIAGIIGLMEILRDPGATLTPVEMNDIHGDVYDSALRLHRTLRNYLLILDLPSAAPHGAAAPELLSALDVERSLGEGLGEALRLNRRRADLHLHIAPCRLAARAPDLARIVEELADNACKFSRPGTPVEVRLDAGGRLAVTDRGRGMTAEEIARIGAFQQFDRRHQEQQGLGLGLVLVQKLAALGGARVALTSQPGEGTRVEVAFPAAAS